MKTHLHIILICKNYFDWTGEYLALIELLAICKRRRWLCHPVGFGRLFCLHESDIMLYWNPLYLKELVMLLRLLKENNYIEIKGSRGFWKAVERHLVDFNGNPIHCSLSDINYNIEEFPEANQKKWNRVRRVIAAMEMKFPPKK